MTRTLFTLKTIARILLVSIAALMLAGGVGAVSPTLIPTVAPVSSAHDPDQRIKQHERGAMEFSGNAPY